jgi:hypothetical protein
MPGAIVETEAWRGAQALFVKVMSEFLNTSFVATGAHTPHYRQPFVAEVTLTGTEYELSLSVVVEPREMRRLAIAVLESTDRQDAESLILESGNLLMGALRSILATEGHRFVLGLPSGVCFERSVVAFERAPLGMCTTISSPIASIDLWLRASPSPLETSVT